VLDQRQDLTRLAEDYRRLDTKYACNPRTGLYQKGEDRSIMHCLPDTVDPRVPKTK
jgi:hypothetical protein